MSNKKILPGLKEAQELISKKEIKPSELVSLSLERIKDTDKELNANIYICEEALEKAQELDNKNPEDYPLLGIPLSVKDVFCTKDIATTSASKMLENFVPFYNATVIQKLLDAGALIVSKTNMDEFAMGSSTEFSQAGKSSNPWNLDRVPGGSSGGSAVSVAARQACASLGTDSGGSIRQPASFCGCVGIKPSYGRVSRYGTIAYASSFDQAGPLANSVEDCALMLEIMAGYDEKDATSAKHPVPSYTKALNLKDLKGKKIGIPKELWEEGLDEEVVKECQKAVDKAKEMGAEILELDMPSLNYGVAAYYILASAEASTNLARYDGVRFGKREKADAEDLEAMYIASRSLNFGKEVKRRIILGTYVLSAGYYDAYYKKAAQVRRIIYNEYQEALKKCDALMAPVCPVVAWEHGKFINDPLTTYKMDMLTQSLNLAGLPGLSIPVGLGEKSQMPVGIQIMGRSFDEAGILSIGHALEQNLPNLGLPKALS